VRLVRADEAQRLGDATPDEPGRLVPQWLEGPFNADRLDVAIVTVSPGGSAPPHVHLGGQVIVVTRGRGFVETGGERIVVGEGDVVICPPGELHTHGAEADAPFSHLTVTTGGYHFPEPGAPDGFSGPDPPRG
jgi:quercetin dioxygenase-like cupin family protein